MRIGEMLVSAGLINDQQLKEVLGKQKEEGGKVGSLLVKYGYVEEEDLTSHLSQQYGVPAINLPNFEIDETIFKLIPAETARKYELIPINRTGATLTIAMVDPTNVFAMDDIKFMTGYNVEPVIASEVAILEAIENYYQSTSAIELKRVMDDLTAQSAVDDMEVLDTDEDDDTAISADDLDAAEDAPVIKLVNLIFSDALKRGASDIHLEPYEKEYRVRFRIDGVL